jgi:DNA-binding MarR family transcriptional regulator
MKPNSNDKIDYASLPAFLGYQLRLTQLAVFKDFSESVNDSNITPSLFGVLVVINANPGLKQTELAQAVRLDRSTVVSTLDKLERRQLVERQRVEGDRRTNALLLTDAGRALLQKITPQVEAHEKRLAAGLTERERNTLIELLTKVLPKSR